MFSKNIIAGFQKNRNQFDFDAANVTDPNPISADFDENPRGRIKILAETLQKEALEKIIVKSKKNLP